MRDIAFFGGAFDPPHAGHLAVIEFLASLPLMDEIWAVPVYSHPFLKDMTPFDHRLALLKRLVEGASPKIRVSDIEKRAGFKPSYTVDVIGQAKRENPDARFWLALGTDCLKTLPRWHKYFKLKNEVNFFFLPRPGLAESPFPNVSSTEVRAWLKKRKKGDFIQRLLPGRVLSYIDENGLYR